MTALILLKGFLETQIEIWRPITNERIEQGAYDVSNLGRVRSYLAHPNGNQHAGKTRKLRKEPRILKTHLVPYGYRLIALQTKDGEKTYRVHLLVAHAFLPNLKNETQINHKTAVKSDNRLPNLEWSNHEHNHEHATVNGLRPRGEEHGCARFTESDVRAIRASYENGVRQIDLAKQYGVGRNLIWAIVHRRLWKWLN